MPSQRDFEEGYRVDRQLRAVERYYGDSRLRPVGEISEEAKR